MTQHARPYSVVSLFSGLGGLDLGFVWEQFDLLWANDICENAIATHRLNFGRDAVCKDVTALPISEIPTADVVIGGPPCQSFSLVGPRDPASSRGQLVFKFIEIVREKQPRAFVMENVPGLAASKVNGRRVSDQVREEFEQIGYKVTKVKLTATDYLVPQRRHRLVLIGCRDFVPQVMNGREFARRCYDIDSATFNTSARAAIGDLGPCQPKRHRALYRDVEPSAFAKLMRKAGLPDVSLHECPRLSDTDRKLVEILPPGGTYRDIPDEIAPGRLMKFKKTGGRTTTYGRLHPDRPSYTINTYFRRPNVGCNFHYEEPRLITPREAMRFQSIPDHFDVIYGAQDERNTFIGNAVPPLLARALAISLRLGLQDYDAGITTGTANHLPSQMALTL